MAKSLRIVSLLIAIIVCFTVFSPAVSAATFAPAIDATNIGVQTQYKYDQNDLSWLRKLDVKEDMLSVEGLTSPEVLIPVCSYPYNMDAPNFKNQVAEYVELYTITEDTQRAAYLYLLEQIGVLSFFADPDSTEEDKAQWLRDNGIIVTPEDEKDPEKRIMIISLYAMMKNDLYYVYKGQHMQIPNGTPLEEAIVMYLIALSGEESNLRSFIEKYFGNKDILTLDDYIYYTSLITLYTTGYISPAEVVTISPNEVYRRVAIMAIRNYGIAVDAETATTEEIRQKYLTAMLGTQYRVTLDPSALKKASTDNIIPFYILQRMAYEDAKITISQTRYTYEQSFDIVRKRTTRFDLKHEFYSDITEYNIYLDYLRPNISINPTPIEPDGTTIFINDMQVPGSSYEVIPLTTDEKQTIYISCENNTNGAFSGTVYKLNIYQGKDTAPDSDITNIVPTANVSFSDAANGTTLPTMFITNADGIIIQGPDMLPIINDLNNSANPLIKEILSLNDKGQLVDQYGNVVNEAIYEPLPDGYEYVLGEDGMISVVLTKKPTTEPTTEDGGGFFSDPENRKIIIIVSAVIILLLIVAIIIVLKKGNKKTETEKMIARRDKEKAKRAKKAERENKKKKNY